MVNLPFGVVEEILCRLPVKPLKRFRCVAKSWRALIDSKRFVKLHSNKSFETMSHRHLIVHCGKEVFNVDLDNGDPANFKGSVINPPFRNGVDAISSSRSIFFVISDGDLILWNLFTNECKYLPKVEDGDFPAPFGCYRVVACGIAWDSRNDDYKVVRVVEHMDIYEGNWVASWAHVYELKSNSWRQTVKFNCSVVGWQAEVNGAFHTLILDVTSAKLMAFSVVNERHYEVKLPSSVDTGKGEVLRMKLHKLGGCLSVSYTYESGIDIWVMKEYGLTNSWTKLLSVPMKLTKAVLNDNSIKPLVYTKDGHQVLLLLGFEIFFWHDLRNQTIDSVSVEGLPPLIDNVETCVESLVSLHAEQVHKQVHDPNKEKGKDTTRKKRDGVSSLWFKLEL